MSKIFLGSIILVFMALAASLFAVNKFDLKWPEILSTFGGLTSIFSMIGIIIKSYYDWNIKKSEIKFNKVYENKLAAVRDFIEEFTKLESKLNNIFPKVIVHGIGGGQLVNDWKELHAGWIQFRLKCRLVRLFVESNEIKLINELALKIDEIDEELRKESANLEVVRKGFKEDLPEILSRFEKEIRLEFLR